MVRHILLTSSIPLIPPYPEVASATTNVDNRSAIDLFLAFPSVSSLNSVQASWNIMVRQRPLVEGDSDEPEAGELPCFVQSHHSLTEFQV